MDSRPDTVEKVLVDIEAAPAPFEARPHWGKLFLADAAAIAPLYERRPDCLGSESDGKRAAGETDPCKGRHRLIVIGDAESGIPPLRGPPVADR
jgi:hypothetical protein